MVDVFGLVINIGSAELVLFIAVFVAFLLIVRKVINTLMNILWITIASASFPFIMGFLGVSFPTDLNSILLFVTLGVGVYFVYMLGRVIYALLGIAEKSARFVALPISSAKRRRDEKAKKKMEKLVREKA